jgi:bacillithiol biosynthesis deacetylase BshB1
MADPVKLDVLAIAAHPDDTEITCGGTLLKLAAIGRRTGALDLARGEAGTFGTEADRDAEAEEAARILGLAWRGNAGMPDAAIEYNMANKLIVAQYIRDHKPELVILPHWEQRHPDHLACCRIGYDACFLAGLKKVDLNGEPHRPRKIIYASYYRNREYSFLVDISDYFDKKCEAVAAYKSQFSDNQIAKKIFHPGVTVFDLMRDRGAALAHTVGVRYAEAFTVKEPLLIDDPQTMPVQSI